MSMGENGKREGRKWVPFSAFRSESFRAMFHCMTKGATEVLGNWENFINCAKPTNDECGTMLADLRLVFGSTRGAAQFMGVATLTFSQWQIKGSFSGPSRRLIWICWWLACRPGQVLTVHQIALSGRTSRFCDPATAGNRFTRPPTNSHNGFADLKS